MLSERAPQLRTVEAVLKKNEEVMDALEHGVISPKVAEQMGQCIKTPLIVARLELGYRKMLVDAGKKAPVPRSSLLRSLIPGLDPERLDPSDGAKVRALTGADGQ